MKVITNEKNISDAMKRLDGLADYLYSIGDIESVNAINDIRYLFKNSIEDQDF